MINGNLAWSIVLVIVAAVLITFAIAFMTTPDVHGEIKVDDIQKSGVIQWSKDVECKELGEGRIWCDVKR